MANPAGAGDQDEALRRLVQIFDAIGVEYVVTGSTASSAYIAPRATRDVDVVIRPDASVKPFLAPALAREFTVFPEQIDDAFRTRGSFNVIDERNFTKIDIFVGHNGPSDVFARAYTHVVDDLEIRTISIEDLIVAKLLWARTSQSPLQLSDVHHLLEYPEIDNEYLESEIRRSGLEALIREARDPKHAR